ncbi:MULTISPECIES: type II and III secretion system protein family protein [unclassified Halomonas]|uniref:type II and III secretion system protein family protein n=1 Tax=unclassified Halomonas TaxID=2609666 RepID=UPI001CF3EC44|nr:MULTISPECIES: type II and III secretion system protein family protein [unclassified Halomonas]MCA8862728.1 type II and III secretion system protein family protein [Halomonas sp. SBBP1]UZH09764.1 type II and III secretion system protein family protein [Halomonas sp. BDJS001]
MISVKPVDRNPYWAVRYPTFWVLALLLWFAVIPASADVSVDASGGAMTLETGQGRILRFDQDVASVFVANPEVADVQVVSAGVIYLFGKQAGDTNLIALGADEQSQASLRLQVRDGNALASQALREMDGDSQVRLRMAGNQLVAEGSSPTVESAMVTQSTLDAQAPAGGSINRSSYDGATQINIRVRFAEVARDELLSYGVSWNTLINNGSFSFGVLTSNIAPNPIGGGTDSIDGLLQALQQNNLLQILAEPNITTVSGQTASFLAGGEIPIPVPVNSELVGIEYKQFGVSLLSTPTLLPNGRISMEVRPEVSSIASDSVRIGGYDVPSLQVRRADTVVEVGSGQTFAIAGLFQRQASNQIERIPLLGDMPILGNLFRSRRFQRNETELVILITPYLVAPSSAPVPRMPLDRAQVSRNPQLEDDPFGFYLQ